MRVPSALIVCSAIVAGCASSQSGTGAPPTPSQVQQSGERPLVASLQATNNSGNRILGSVKLTPTGPGQYRAEVQIRNGGGAQNKFPWVIRPGLCGDDTRDILGTELAYRVLETTADGTARVNAPLRVDVPDGPHHVNILKGPGATDRETVVSCGPLFRS